MNIKVTVIRDADCDFGGSGKPYNPNNIDSEYFFDLLKWFCKTKLSEFPTPPDGLLEEFVDQFVKEISAE